MAPAHARPSEPRAVAKGSAGEEGAAKEAAGEQCLAEEGGGGEEDGGDEDGRGVPTSRSLNLRNSTSISSNGTARQQSTQTRTQAHVIRGPGHSLSLARVALG